MPIYKLDALDRDKDLEQVSEWLLANGISPQDCFVPSFIDTDAQVIHWLLVVTPNDSEPVEGGPDHPCVVGRQLPEFGLRAPSAGAWSQRVGVQMQTPLVVPLPAEILAVS